MNISPNPELPPSIYNEILDTMQDAILSYSLVDRRFIYTNPAVEKVFGCRLQDHVDDPNFLQRIVHPDDLEAALISREKTLREGVSERESRIIWPDGQVRWLHYRTWINYDAQGRPIRANEIVQDITERKQAEAALRESEARLQMTLDATQAGTWEWTIPTGETKFNERWAEILGYTLDELAPVSIQTWLDLAHPEDLERSNARLEVHFTHQTPWYECEARMKHKDGRWVWVWDRGTVLEWSDDGRPLRMFGIHLDITQRKHLEKALRDSERKQAETALRESEERYRTTISTMSEGIVMQGADGAIQVCNTAAESILGLTADQMMGRTSIDPGWHAIHEDGSPFPGETHPAMVTLRTGKPQHRVIMGVHKPNGEMAWISINSQAVINPGETHPAAVVASFTDVTEQRQNEAIIQQQRKDDRQMQVYLKALHNATIRLTRTETLDEFYRVAVEEALNEFGFERVGLLLYDPADGTAVGTYGTDAAGNLVAEYDLRLAPDNLTGILKRTLDREERFAFEENTPLFANQKPIGMGQNAVATLWNGEALGWLAIDNAIHHRPITKAQLDVLGLYALTVGSLLSRKRAENDLRESEQRYRLLAENIQDVIVKLSPDGIFTFVSPSSYGLTGHHPKELVGTLAKDAVYPEDAQVAPHALNQALESGATFFTFPHRLPHKDGHYVWVEVTNTIVRDAETGTPLEIIGIIHDITERRQAEEALRESEARYQSVVQTQSELICRYQPDLTLTFVNDAYCRYFDKKPEELIGRSFLELVPESERQATKAFYEELVRTRGETTYEHQVVHANGKICWQLWTDKVILDDADEVIAIQAVGVDITERKQAEAALEQALAQEKQLGELKSRFISMTSHEFRTPLAAILATTETLTHYRQRMDDMQIDYRLDKIRQQVNHLKDTMEEVLILDRIQAGRLRFEPVVGDLDELCQAIIEEFQSRPEYRQRIVYRCMNVPVMALFDQRLMRQIVSNLISNGLKYSPPHTAVQIELAHDAEIIRFQVSDNGIGIPADDLTRLFEPFHRADNVGTISGTGLGLSITKKAVEAHKGSITVESAENQGTTFTVVLPLVNE
ncbi:MAG: PAS domain S-box protein [Anaerolineales bacterium]|nr:PAS domain S-box protein [Anaerolineales bacterium]